MFHVLIANAGNVHTEVIVFQYILGHENNHCFLFYKAVRFRVVETDLRQSILTIVLSFVKSSSPPASILKDLKTT